MSGAPGSGDTDSGDTDLSEFDSSEFDRAYWEQHWQGSQGEASAPNPHLVREVGGLTPGTALDAGCGEGGEARWLAGRGWHVTAVDISREALARAAALGGVDDGDGDAGDARGRVHWVEADLTTWTPDRQYDLVTTLYAHPTMPQLDFYDRVAAWVAPGGSLLVVGHLHREGGHGHGTTSTDDPPEHATVTLADITERLDPGEWDVQTASEHTRSAAHGSTLHDVVVRARRRD
jgi:SAM-dependent methyltransferase